MANFITLHCIGVFKENTIFDIFVVVLCVRKDVLSTDSDIYIPSLICFAKINLLEQ